MYNAFGLLLFNILGQGSGWLRQAGVAVTDDWSSAFHAHNAQQCKQQLPRTQMQYLCYTGYLLWSIPYLFLSYSTHIFIYLMFNMNSLLHEFESEL